jgi:phosphatidylglycerophosphate synthase
MNFLLDACRQAVRSVMRGVAKALNKLSGGRLSPNTVTIFGLLMHLPIAWLIIQGYLVAAGLFLIIFGLFDTLDGELARLQGRSSPAGMFLDSVTDRIKEILVYLGIGGYVTNITGNLRCPDYNLYCMSNFDVSRYVVPFIILALGWSMLTSYINAWGEAVMGRNGVSPSRMNKTFRGGLASFEIRMFLLVIGLITGKLYLIVVIITILASLTISSRIIKVFRELNRVQS